MPKGNDSKRAGAKKIDWLQLVAYCWCICCWLICIYFLLQRLLAAEEE